MKLLPSISLTVLDAYEIAFTSEVAGLGRFHRLALSVFADRPTNGIEGHLLYSGTVALYDSGRE